MSTATADFSRETALSPIATLMDQLGLARTDRAGNQPHLAIVIATVILALGLWFVIYAVSGRLVRTW